MENPDFLIIGGGVIGILLSINAKNRYPRASVVVLEKENSCGLHASGRNSGVLHAGFYYAEHSLKARFTVTGNTEMKAYCRARGIPLNECGKLVVAKWPEELTTLDSLLERGKKNGVELQVVSEAEAKEIEPRVKTYQRALFSPSTATVQPSAVMRSLVIDARKKGVDVRTDTPYRNHRNGVVHTDQARFDAGYVINAGGLYADRIARDFGYSSRYRIIPFKGLYLHSNEPPGSWRTNIYPVPDLERPFLGVHFTVTVDGRAKIGPTAVPAFWREQYSGFERFDLKELVNILWREGHLFLCNRFGFRDLALDELKKYHRPTLVRMASGLANGVTVSDYQTWGEPGIRAQLMDVESGNLVMDFLYEGDDRSFHVLNAVSPGFTCAFPFTEYLFDQIDDLLR